MERYKELAALRCFTHDDMVQLAGSESSAVWQIKSYLQKGYIERVRRKSICGHQHGNRTGDPEPLPDSFPA